ncbi:MAG TPA: tetratricopeptide repeat protein [Tepidisphaeraceae bacterium]|nr:tetratricopeptide repeat protein [Tepidisphaeraceae bacterium]
MSDQSIDAAIRQHSAGNLAAAEAMYRSILGQKPDHPGALHLLGVALSQQGNKRSAIDYISRAIAINPQVADFHANLALVHLENGEPDKALIACQRTLALQPNHVDALHQLGNALKQLGRAEESIEPYQRAIALRPDFVMAMGNLAESLRKIGRNAEADALTERVLALSPGDPKALAARGESLLRQKKNSEAAEAFRAMTQKWPSEWAGYNGLGVALYGLGKFDEAIALYEKAAALSPENPGPLNNLGYASVGQGRIDEGIPFYREALSIRPDFADAHNNLGNAHLAKLDLDAAMRSYEDALYFQPDHSDAHWNRALLHLLRGEFERGWLEYEWRWLKFPEVRRYFAKPLWDGFDIAGKTILLHAEQGFGDTIQFVRLAPLVAARGATVNLECQPELEGLLQHVPGVARTVSCGDRLPPFDVHCPLLSLPRALGIGVKNIPAEVPYLQVDQNLSRKWGRKLKDHDGYRIIGVVWAGARTHRRDTERSIPIESLAPLNQIQGVRLFSLQKEVAPQGIRVPGMVDFTTELHDFADTAAFIANLDLVIGVDTAVVHLAGALGRKVWTLLPYSPDWRWLLNRDDSPWYPTMRLFRQPGPGDWATVVGNVVESLSAEGCRGANREGEAPAEPNAPESGSAARPEPRPPG